MGLVKAILLIFLLYRIQKEMNTLCFYYTSALHTWKCTATSMTVCHHIGDILEGASAAAQKGKNMYFYYCSSKRIKNWKKTATVCGHRADTRRKLWHLVTMIAIALSPHCLSSDINMLRQTIIPAKGWDLPAKNTSGSSGENCWSLQKNKKLFSSPRFNTKEHFNFFSKKHFPFKETLKFEI
jgi:hypothetical protein